MKITNILHGGEFNIEEGDTTQDLLESGGGALDRAGLTDAILFQTEDGKFRVGTFEFVIADADPEYIRDTLLNGMARCDNCGNIEPIDGLAGVEDPDERTDADGPEPAGECSKCGCLSYELTEADVKKMLRKGKK